jgi:hypothetical protein
MYNIDNDHMSSVEGAELRYYRWGCELVLPGQMGVAEVVPDGRKSKLLLLEL